MKGLFSLLLLPALILTLWAGEGAVVFPTKDVTATSKTDNPTTATDAITIPRMLSYQGKLTDDQGNPVPNGDYQLTFRLYPQETGGNPFWSETQTVRVEGGLFSVLLGRTNPIPSIPENGAIWLSLQVGSNPELSPRLRIVSSPYSFISERSAQADSAIGAQRVGGLTLSGLDNRYVEENQANSITSGMIVDRTILGQDLNQMGAGTGQVLKWNGSNWVPGNDEVGGDNNAWVRGTPDSVLYTIRQLGIARGGADNMLYGSNRFTHTNLGVACTTGTIGQDKAYCTVGGGVSNNSSGWGATIGGGEDNTASGYYATVAGGLSNTVSGIDATVGGGADNTASGNSATVGGGGGNTASDNWATVGGGESNTASGPGATVGGGQLNTASGNSATVAGGNRNTASVFAATVGGGYADTASGNYATVGGGYRNTASGNSATVGGGAGNIASGNYATVGGGYINTAWGISATVAGGSENTASGYRAMVGGGWSNYASDTAATVAGGRADTALGRFATVGGGYRNKASGLAATVGGGNRNTASGEDAVVAGGEFNRASGNFATVAGGDSNTASGNSAFVGGGYRNTASGGYATVAGGYYNTASGWSATVAGGYADTAAGYCSFAVGDHSVVPASYSNSAAFNSMTATASGQLRCGTLAKAGGSFTIDHPLDPYNKILNHYFIEGPEMLNLYRGSVILDANGRAEVKLPEYFSALNRNPHIQLTGVGTSDVYVLEDIKGNTFVIGGKPGTKVYWQVTGERADVSAEAIRRLMPVEQLKTGALSGRMLDDEFLSGCMEQLEREGKASGINFRTAEGRRRYEEMKNPPRVKEENK